MAERPGVRRTDPCGAGSTPAGRKPGAVLPAGPGPPGPARPAGTAAGRGPGRRPGPRDTVAARRARTLATVFGDVGVERLADRARGHADLHPAAAVVHLPQQQHSHGLRRLAAVQAARGWFAEAAGSVAQATGQRLGNRQAQQLAQRAAVDFDQCSATRSPPLGEAGDVLVLAGDGKGVVLRPAASTTAPRSPQPPARSCPHLTSSTHPAAPDHGRGATGWSPASPPTPPG